MDVFKLALAHQIVACRDHMLSFGFDGFLHYVIDDFRDLLRRSVDKHVYAHVAARAYILVDFGKCVLDTFDVADGRRGKRFKQVDA